MYLDLGRLITGSQDLHGARVHAVDPRPQYLLQDRSSLLQHQSTSQGNMGDSEPPGILCESCACIIHTINLGCFFFINRPSVQFFFAHISYSHTVKHSIKNLQSCMSIISETFHDQSFSHI